MRLVAEWPGDDPLHPLLGKLQHDESPLICTCGHLAPAHYEVWPALNRPTGDGSYKFVPVRPFQAGCDLCEGCKMLHIEVERQTVDLSALGLPG